MTPRQKKTYKKHLAIYECKNKYPELSWQEIAERFGYNGCTNMSRIYNRVKHHLESGEPYYNPCTSSHNRSNRGVKYERVNVRTVKDDVKYLAKLGVRF